MSGLARAAESNLSSRYPNPDRIEDSVLEFA